VGGLSAKLKLYRQNIGKQCFYRQKYYLPIFYFLADIF